MPPCCARGRRVSSYFESQPICPSGLGHRLSEEAEGIEAAVRHICISTMNSRQSWALQGTSTMLFLPMDVRGTRADAALYQSRMKRRRAKHEVCVESVAV